jgi:hypothetical protein
LTLRDFSSKAVAPTDVWSTRGAENDVDRTTRGRGRVGTSFRRENVGRRNGFRRKVAAPRFYRIVYQNEVLDSFVEPLNDDFKMKCHEIQQNSGDYFTNIPQTGNRGDPS